MARTRSLARRGAAWLVGCATAIMAPVVAAAITVPSVGVTEIAGQEGHGPITVFYPSSSPAATILRGSFHFELASDGSAVRGNDRLVVISHGSGGSAWTQADLAQALVRAGYIVALPEHAGDNWQDMGKVGPRSWKLRPGEVSGAIDAVARAPRFAALFEPKRVGVFGMSAGGHTALTLAGGRWNSARLLEHCEQHLADDFPTCVGANASLNGDWLDGIKKAIAMPLVRWHFSREAGWNTHTDPRIRAVVAAVPLAADFDLASLTHPTVPLGIVQARGDTWLAPRHHSAPVIAACASCEVVADLPDGGHGAALSPLPNPDRLPERVMRLLSDPPGFDRRTQVPALHAAILAFFNRHLLP